MKAFDRWANLFAKVPGLAKPWPRRIVALLVAIVLIAAVAALLSVLLPLLPARFWQLLGLCLLALGVLWWFTLGAKRYSRQGFSRKSIGDLGPGNPEDERLPLERMMQAIAEAKNTILRSPQIDKGKDPLYRIPWYLCIGDAAADVPGMLKAASTISPFPAPAQSQGDANQLWRWWFFKSLIAIETHPRVVCDSGARLDRGLWYQALRQLAVERERLPLNGMVVCIAAATLLGPADELKNVSLRLRRLVDEAMEHLQANFPVYCVVTGLERLPGYAAFRSALPKPAFEQALGHRLAESDVISAATSRQLDTILQPILDRLHALRLSAMRTQPAIEGRRGVFEFVESLRRLEGGLGSFVTLLLEDNPFQRTPRWRGLYFTGAASAEAPAGAFVADLFQRFLPTDQPLASPSLRGKTGRMSVAALGTAAMLGLSASLILGFSAARHDDARLLVQSRDACSELSGDSQRGARIAALASCGRTIQQLQVSADKTLLSFGIRRADVDIERLKQTVVDDFSNQILAPYDQMLESDLAQGRVGIEHVLAVTQRLRMLSECRSHTDECLQRELPNNVAFDPASRLFAPFVSSDYNAHTDREDAAALLSTYLGYLRWQKRSVLNAEETRLKQLLGRILTAYTPRAEDMEHWAAARSDGLKLTDFWLPSDRVVGVESGALAAVSGAYTLDTWTGVVAPMIATASDALPEKKTLLDEFRSGFFSAYFRAWGTFQSRFGDGLKLWQGQFDQLALRAAGHENPYQFFFASAQRNLFELPLKLPLRLRWAVAWSQIKANWAVGWRPFFRFAAGLFVGPGPAAIDPPVWVLALKESEIRVLAPEEPLFAKGYLRLQVEGGGQDLYQIAADVFRAKGVAAQPPASEYTQILQAVEKPDERYAPTFRAEDLSSWSIVQGPSRLLLFLTVYRTAQFIQGKWQAGVYEPLKNASPQDRAAALYGAQGKLAAFVGDWLKPFVTDRENAPVNVGGVSLPLSPAFAGLLARQHSEQSLPDASKPFPAGTFQFTRPSEFGAAVEGQLGTTLEVECQDRTFSASTHAESLAEARVAVFWSPSACLETRLKIALPDPAPAGTEGGGTLTAPAAADSSAPAKLIKVYSGGEGVLTLISDFADGSKSYKLSDFQAAYTPKQWSDLGPRLRALNAADVRVFLQVDLSDEMKRFLASRNEPSGLPASILN